MKIRTNYHLGKLADKSDYRAALASACSLKSSPMEELLKSSELAIICGCDRLIELVDRVVNRDDRTLGPEDHVAHTASTRSRESWVDHAGRRAS